MNSSYDVQLTKGYVLRHAPAQGGPGWEAALIDIAQDLLLRHLAEVDVLNLFAFKGGTALRKFFAGAAGRFSTDLDFSVANVDDDARSALDLLVEHIDGVEIGGFRYSVTWRNNKPSIRYQSELGDAGQNLESKIDVGPPPWLAPTARKWVPVPIHDRYGGQLPSLQVMDLAENIAEKIARLNRVNPPRDAYDLWWVARTPGNQLDHNLVRRLAVLKCWVDTNGLTGGASSWRTLPQSSGFDTERWLTLRRARDFDDDSIGLLTAPSPDLDELGRELIATYRWVADLDGDEQVVARGHAGDRGLVLRMLAKLPSGRMSACR
ncbi:nucleotidyl transferase AbiEii/AbiGii toxin family protein [Acidimicrobiaceae bacterium AH-315-P05]|nr:nucleotidyl transferase AbiEii/AbiGii toxin family protein [Acidimicrobiaceae bacterium AH-315-P05]